MLNNKAKKGGEWGGEKVYQISVLNFHYKNGDKSERGIMEATRIIKTMSEEDAAFFRELSRDKAIRDYNAGMSAATKKGLEKGLAKGIKQGREEGVRQKAVEDARSFYANGASLELIAKSLKMTVEQVKEIVAAEPAPAQA